MKKIIRHLRNYKRFSINLVLIILFFVFISCKHSGTRLFSLYDLRSDIKDIYVILEFKTNNKIYRRKITSKTKKIKLNKDSELYSIEHDTSFCTKIVAKDCDYDIYIFPNESVMEQDDYYIVKEAKDVYAYFIEYYDDINKKNFYIFSKDNKINKEPLISENFYSSDILYTLNEEDLFFYNDDTQVLSFPYAGYVIKSRDDSLILLSNLWDINLID